MPRDGVPVKYRLKRDGEFGDLKAGEIVYSFVGPTYGCIDYNNGRAMSRVQGKNPFYEVAHDNLEPVEESDEPS